MKVLAGFVVCTKELHTGKRIELVGWYPLSRKQRINAENMAANLTTLGLPCWTEKVDAS